VPRTLGSSLYGPRGMEGWLLHRPSSPFWGVGRTTASQGLPKQLRRLGVRVSRRFPFVLAWIAPGASHGVSKDAPPSVHTLGVHSRSVSPGLALWFFLASACPRQGTGLVPPSWFSTTLTAFSAVRLAGLLHPAADPGVRRVPGSFVVPVRSEAEASSCSGKGSFRDAPPFEVSPRSQPSAVSPRFSRTPALLPFAFRRRFGSRAFLRDRVHGLPTTLRLSGPYNFLGFLLSSEGRPSGLLAWTPRGGSIESLPPRGRGADARGGWPLGSGARGFFQAGFASRRPVSRVRLLRAPVLVGRGLSVSGREGGFVRSITGSARVVGDVEGARGGGSCLGRLVLPMGRSRGTAWTGTRR